MADQEQRTSEQSDEADGDLRCPNCDSVLTISSGRCLMCGEELEDSLINRSESRDDFSAEDHSDQFEPDDQGVMPIEGETNDDDEVNEINRADKEPTNQNDVIDSRPNAENQQEIESVLIEKRSKLGILLLGFFVALIGVVAFVILSSPTSISLALLPTATEPATRALLTPTRTPLPSETPQPSVSPSNTSTPFPTETPRSPRLHQVVSGETLFSLSLRYAVSMDSIANENGIEANAGLQVSQNLLIPWPTATPPLEPVQIDLGGRVIVADPTDCNMYEIKSGDTFLGIAHRERVDLEALTAVNRFTDQTILQPGDLICIPKIIVGGQLPPTAGPSPTPSETAPPAGPSLLYPIEEAEIEPADQPFYLQWAAVKDLESDEWYMIELTDLTLVDSHPMRAFTRDNAIRIPLTWRPDEESTHLFRWRVRIVSVTGERDDGSFIYTFGGTNSVDALFYWQGAVPTPTATATATPTVTPVPG